MSYQPKVYREQGGNKIVIASGGEIEIQSGATLDIQSGATMSQSGVPAGASFSIGTESSDIIVVGIQLNDGAGVALANRAAVTVYLSDDANGDAIASATPSGTVGAGTDGLVMPSGGDSKKLFTCVSEADGDIDLSIEDTAGSTYYVAVVLPNGKLSVSGAVTFAT